MRRTFIIVIFFVFTFVMRSQRSTVTPVMLSDSAQVSIITCGPGDELYSLFGHTAIRVLDVRNNIDLVFNYGTFDFSTPNFFGKFVKGELDYHLSYYPYRYFEPNYIAENRWVNEQVLSLSNAQVNILFRALINNGLETNRYYRYDFFFDNCATRVRDILVKSIPQVTFKKDCEFTNVTLRDEMNKYLINSSWTEFGLNLILGRFCDVVVDNWSSMYLPNNLMMQVSKATIKHNTANDSVTILSPLCVNRIKSCLDTSSSLFLKPISLILFLLAISVILTFLYKNNTLEVVFDNVLWITLSTFGVVVVFLTFFSSHSICRQNLNLLWLSPIYLFFLYPIKVRFGNFIHSSIALLVAISICIYLMAAVIGFQAFSFESYILCIIIILQCYKKLELKWLLKKKSLR